MTKRIFIAISAVSAAVLLANIIIVMGCLYQYYRGIQESQLGDELYLAAQGVEKSGRGYLEGIDSKSYRLTWVAPDGTVLFDTAEDYRKLENHGDREEIREAILNGEGESSRFSGTMTEETFYRARRLADGTVLRISVSRATMFTLVMVMLQPMTIVGILAAVFSALLAHRLAKRIVRPLNRLDLDRPLENEAYEELSPLLRKIDHQRLQISEQMQSMKKRADEFTQITSHMSEGLVLLDSGGKIVSINPAAKAIFNTGSSCLGQDFLLVDHSHAISSALDKAAGQGHSEIKVERGGREYQLDLSRIQSDGAPAGTVLLAFDVTERSAAERARREFTANVSHELKTPLQVITGSAEMLEDGTVKPGDAPQFIHLIRTEAARMMSLVEDIIHLSRLDEGAAVDFERVDLYDTARAVVSALESRAKEKNAAMSVSGEKSVVMGVPGLLYEMIYNLCDNAIKYNVDGGSVEVDVSPRGGGAVLMVKDTGIGIPLEYQDRVFERFFRVDKSRSRAIGGTGLGLSIVKHIAQVHGAAVNLSSRVGEGTLISVVF